MAEEFLSDSIASSSPNFASPTPEREPVRMMLIGSHEGVTEKIHTLHALGFAEAGAWSPLLPTPNPGEVMSILTQYRKRNRKSGR
jgi:hypothetical protein